MDYTTALVSDGGANTIPAATAGLSGDSNDVTDPTLLTNVLDLNVEPGTLVLGFSEGVTVPTIGAITLGGVSDYILTTSTVTSGSVGESSFTITLSDVDKYNVNLDDDDTNDMDYTTALVSDGTPNTIAAVTDDTLSGVTEDTTAPLIVTAALDLDIGDSTLTLTFDEFVDESLFDPTQITIVDASDLNGVTLVAASPTESADGLIMTIALTNVERTAIAAHTGTSQIDATTSTWDDVAITPNSNLIVTSDPVDTTDEDTAGPLIATSTLNLDGDSPTLVLTFDETVDFSTFDSTAIAITASGGGSSQALSGVPTEGADGTTMTIPITLAQKEVIAAQAAVREIDAELQLGMIQLNHQTQTWQ